MIFTLATIALVAALPSFASPISKRYSGTVIRSNRNNQCLTIPAGQAAANGVLLTTGDCATATRWDINPGSGSVIVSGTNFALDAGTNPSNNVPAKIWTSYPGLTQQTWFLTGDNRIAITGGTQCLDEGPSGPQTYQCATGNTNQIWFVGDNGTPSASASSSMASASASASSTSSAPATSSSAPPSTGTHLIKWRQDQNYCLTPQGTPADGTLVNLGVCIIPPAANQIWNFQSSGNIQLNGTNFCLDAGVNPSNGVQMKLWDCYSGLSQQTWALNGNLLQTANNQCLDVDNSNNLRLQTWACSNPDPQQQFILL